MRALALLAALLLAAGALVVAVERPWHRHGTSALAPSGSLLLLGDSLDVGVEADLHRLLPRWTIATDAEVGRATATGLEHLRATGDLPPYLVISLGTNDPAAAAAAFRKAVDEVLARATPLRCVVWATIHRDGAHGAFNAVLRDAAARSRNLHLVEWDAMVTAHPDLLAPDGIHGTPDGYRRRAQAIVRALASCPAVVGRA